MNGKQTYKMRDVRKKPTKRTQNKTKCRVRQSCRIRYDKGKKRKSVLSNNTCDVPMRRMLQEKDSWTFAKRNKTKSNFRWLRYSFSMVIACVLCFMTMTAFCEPIHQEDCAESDFIEETVETPEPVQETPKKRLEVAECSVYGYESWETVDAKGRRLNGEGLAVPMELINDGTFRYGEWIEFYDMEENYLGRAEIRDCGGFGSYSITGYERLFDMQVDTADRFNNNGIKVLKWCKE